MNLASDVESGHSCPLWPDIPVRPPAVKIRLHFLISRRTRMSDGRGHECPLFTVLVRFIRSSYGAKRAAAKGRATVAVLHRRDPRDRGGPQNLNCSPWLVST